MVACTAAICFSSIDAAPAPVTPGPPISATITSAGGAPLMPQQDNGVFERVALRPHQPVTIVLRGLRAASGEQVKLQAPDGGALSDNALTPAADATGAVTFEPGQHAGIYRLIIWSASGQSELRFLVVDPTHPLPANSPILRG